MLNGVLKEFQAGPIEVYLNRCWKDLSNHAEAKRVTVHICSWNVRRGFRNTIEGKYGKALPKKPVIRVICGSEFLLLRTDNMSSVRNRREKLIIIEIQRKTDAVTTTIEQIKQQTSLEGKL